MYARTMVYKIYSVFMLVASFLGGLSAIIFTVPLIQNIPVLAPLREHVVLIEVSVIITALLSVFFAYIEFSSMYGFTDMIAHENSNSINPMIKRGCVLPSKFYSVYGMVIFAIVTVFAVVSCLAIIITTSLAKRTFLCVPIIPLAIIIAVNVLFFVHYFVRYKAVSVLLDVTTSKEMTEPLRQKLAEIDTKWLRGYCGFLAGFCVVAFAAFVVSLFFIIEPLYSFFAVKTEIATGLLISYIVYVIVALICTGIFGCYVDNIAKMVEHHQIKHKIIG